MPSLSTMQTYWLTRVGEGLKRVRERMANASLQAQRSAKSTQLVAISKTKPADAVWAAFQHGQTTFGENRVQEALDKIHTLERLLQDAPQSPIQWHMVGHLQTNKAKHVKEKFSLLHSVDTLRLAQVLDAQQHTQQVPLAVLIQVNYSGEKSKSGVDHWDALEQLVENVQMLPRLRLQGLMCIPPSNLGEKPTRTIFAEVQKSLRELRERFHLGSDFATLSMGMSDDLEWAIAEGSTLVRIGQAIFGHRT